jgi:hypothetical protein
MHYKRFEYSVLQTASPTGWKWTVHLHDQKAKTGEAPDRQSGVLRAMAFIDRTIQAKMARTQDG